MSDVDPIARVDPELRAILSALPDFSTLSDATLAKFRALFMGEPVATGRDQGVVVTQVSIPSRHGGTVPALLYRPESASAKPRPALLNIHGGGYVLGAAERDDAAMRAVARNVDCVVLSPNYRLAPEAPHPAALHDCDAALHWLQSESMALGVDTQRLVVRGASAGGGLALGLALLARDAGGPGIALLQLVYPMVDDRTGEHPSAGKFVWPAAANRYGWDSLLRGQNRASPSPYAVPGRATNLADLPPVFLAVGGIDLFVLENLALAARLTDSGVAVEMHVYPGAYHGFPLVADSRVAKSLARDIDDSLRRALTQT
jgi:acetyl esterase/lipase